MTIGKILSNSGEGIAGAAAEQSRLSKLFIGDKEGRKVINDELDKHFGSLRKSLEGDEKSLKEFDILAKPMRALGKAEMYFKGMDRHGALAKYDNAFDVPDGLYEKAQKDARNSAIARTSGAVALGGAAMVGTRYLSGGNLSTNNSGQRDIVGIPFV